MMKRIVKRGILLREAREAFTNTKISTYDLYTLKMCSDKSFFFLSC